MTLDKTDPEGVNAETQTCTMSASHVKSFVLLPFVF